MNYMRFDILCVGKLKDRAFDSRCREYLKWLSPYARIRLEELPDSSMEKENAALLHRLEKVDSPIIVLSEDGKGFSSRAFASKLSELSGHPLTFVIGGPSGLLPAVKQRASLLWSLSPLTFTHELARLLLCEQLFRAVSILRNSPYHIG